MNTDELQYVTLYHTVILPLSCERQGDAPEGLVETVVQRVLSATLMTNAPPAHDTHTWATKLATVQRKTTTSRRMTPTLYSLRRFF